MSLDTIGSWSAELYRGDALLLHAVDDPMVEDPIGFVAGVDFHSYAANNPVNTIDPLGLAGLALDPKAQEALFGPSPGPNATDGERLWFKISAALAVMPNVGTLNVPGAAGRACVGPAGRVSTLKYLKARWDKATFETVERSIQYHWEGHGKRLGLSVIEYTQEAMKALADESARIIDKTDRLGREAIEVVSRYGKGLYTKAGKIIWFDPKP